jgi:aromatic-L-amino-acid/L-tryptophan decarboxylase
VAEADGYHMTADEFRRRGHQLVDWVARYLDEVESYPVLSTVAPGDVRRVLPPSPPARPEDWDDIVADLDRVVVPGLTHWQSPNWFAYFPGNSSGPSVLGDLVSSGVGVQGMLWSTSPACTEVETHVCDWLVELLGLPEAFRSDGAGGGVIQPSGSDANLCAILAARDRTGVDDLGRLRAYTSTQAHSSIEKGIRIAGLRPDQLRLVDVDDEFAMRPDALADAIGADAADGSVPFVVAATVGTTSSLAIDPVAAIAETCRAHGVWLHVDAAMAGSAAVVPALRPVVNAGLDHVDSWCFDPHKWLFTNLDCTVLFLRDRAPLIDSLSVLPEYLRNEASASGAVIDYRDWHVSLGRRFRALKLWFVLRHYGAEGLAHHVGEHVALAASFAARVDAHPRLERLAPARLGLVCFAHAGGDEATQRLLDDLNGTGRVALTHTRLAGRLAIRVSIGQTRTGARHVDALWTLIEERS